MRKEASLRRAPGTPADLSRLCDHPAGVGLPAAVWRNTFDLVTAVETQYYWPDLPGDRREILRVLKPGGTLVVIAESCRGGSTEVLQRPVMKLLKSSILGRRGSGGGLLATRGSKTWKSLQSARRDGCARWAKSRSQLENWRSLAVRVAKVRATCGRFRCGCGLAGGGGC